MKLTVRIFGDTFPVIFDTMPPLTSSEVETKLSEWEALLEQGRQEEADALYDQLSEDGALEGGQA